jgi:peptide-methionine (S)-S-oxide reductase
MPNDPATSPPPAAQRALATFGGGCFWCTEAVLEQLDGVLDVCAGYCGGEVEAPTYEQICTGTTGHAEVVQVTFDPARITYATLLDWFFRAHDPTTRNRQGPDEGTQYRSVVFTHSATQQAEALAAIERAQARFADPIVTEVVPAPRFWPAEAYHQDYFRNNPDKGYCRVMIAPKLKRLGLDRR